MIIPTKCRMCRCDLITGKHRNFIYFKGNYYCLTCFKKPNKNMTEKRIESEKRIFVCPNCKSILKRTKLTYKLLCKNCNEIALGVE